MLASKVVIWLTGSILIIMIKSIFFNIILEITKNCHYRKI